MSDIQSAAVKSLAEQIVKAINTITEKNNKSYVNARVTRYGGSGNGGSSNNTGTIGGTYTGKISTSQVTGLYDVVSNYLINAQTNASNGDENALKIVSTLNGISDVRIANATIKTAQIDELYGSYAEFIRLVADKAEIKDVDADQVRADIAELGTANIGSADIGFGQIKDLVTGTAIIRQGTASKLYIDELAVTDANMVSLTTGELILKRTDGKFANIVVDENGNITTKEVSVEGDNIANNTIAAGKIIENTITARELNVSKIFADEALVNAIKASNIDTADLFADNGFVSNLTTSIINSPSIGEDLDISKNSSITLTKGKIDLLVSSESTSTNLVLTDTALKAIGDNIDLSANKSVTASVENKVTGAIDKKFPQQDTAPENPSEGDLWLNIGVTPNVLEIYKKDSETQELGWEIVNDVDKSALASRVSAAELKITDSAIVQTVTSSSSYSGLVDRVETAESKLTPTAMETTIEGSTALSNVKQTADKINWIIASGDSASAMQLTDEALAIISDNVTISTDKIKITSGDQIASSVINSLNLANNTTVKSLETDIGTAQSTADTAKSTADSAATTASSANTTAQNANSVAGYASSKAEGAKSDAAAAKSAAATAQSDADAAQADATQALKDAKDASDAAATAQGGVDSLVTRMDSAELELTQDKIVSKVTSSEVYKSLDGQVTTNKNNIAAVTQTANKIEWIVADDATASAVKLTSDAYKVIADNIDLSANNTVKITSGDQISAEAAGVIDLSSNSTIQISSADQILLAARKNMDLSQNSTIATINSSIDTVDGRVDGVSDAVNSLRDTTSATKDQLSVLSQYVVIQEDGTYMKAKGTKNEMKLTNEGVGIYMNGQTDPYSQFAANYVQFGKYQLRKSADGGLVFKMAEE